MTLTSQDLDQLKKPFNASDEYTLNKSGMSLTYIREDAIADRIESVDPAWSMTEPDVIEDDGKNVSVKVGVTIKGVTRWGVGSDKRNSANEAVKSAATDAFKRAARMFGVGRYLLSGDSSSTSTAPQRNTSSLPQAAPVADGAIEYTKGVTSVKVLATRKGTSMYIIGDASMFESQPLKDLGYNTDGWQPGNDYTLGVPVDVKWKQSGKYKNIIALQRTDNGSVAQVAA